MGGSTFRIAMYSHDAVGMGHVRRNLMVARALAAGGGRSAGCCTLLVCGASEAGAFAMPPGVDCLTLPALRKTTDGTYVPRRLGGVAPEQVLSLRAAAISGALGAYDPDVLIVDKLPRGVGRELEPALELLRRRGRTRCVLGLRDVLDAPSTVRREWERDESEAAALGWYDAVWVYGSRAVYDPVAEYRLSPAVAALVRYTGYFDSAGDQPAPDVAVQDPLAALNLSSAPFALCMVGGGEDGAFLAEAFARAPLPRGMNAVLVTGPFMPADARRRVRYEAEGQPRLRVIDFTAAPQELVRRAARVVAMGGYNTVWESLSHGKRCLIAPRVAPRQEQRIRAERLASLGLLDVLPPDQVTPAAIGQWLATDLPPRPLARDVVDMDGLRRLPVLLDELMATPVAARAAAPIVAASPQAPAVTLFNIAGLQQKGALPHVAP